MELVAVILSAVNLIILCLYLGRLHNRPVQIELVYMPPVQGPVEDKGTSQEEPLTMVSESLPANDDQSRYAWKNERDIPISFPRQSVAGGQAPPPSGPLERPSGFAR